MVEYISKIPTIEEFNYLNERVGWGKEKFYKKFGFITRSEADLGEGMILKL